MKKRKKRTPQERAAWEKASEESIRELRRLAERIRVELSEHSSTEQSA